MPCFRRTASESSHYCASRGNTTANARADSGDTGHLGMYVPYIEESDPFVAILAGKRMHDRREQMAIGWRARLVRALSDTAGSKRCRGAPRGTGHGGFDGARSRVDKVVLGALGHLAPAHAMSFGGSTVCSMLIHNRDV